MIRSEENGVALIIVLAFVVLLTGVVVAYLSRTTSDRRLAVGAFGDVAADLLAKSAINVIVGDFKQEIVTGSNPIPTGTTPATYYSPTSNANVVPRRNVVGIPNLVRVSIKSDPVAAPPAVASRASVISTRQPSVSGRLVSTSRWNKHCLIPMGNRATADLDPSPIPAFTPPDWVYVTAQGPTPAPAPTSVIGRYAYAVYDEGGLLDMNVAGFPSPTPADAPVGRKGIVTFADLRALPAGAASNPTFTSIGQVVEWRNNATIQATPSSSFPSWQPVTAAGNTKFLNLYLSTSLDFTSPVTTAYNASTKSTDQIFVSRRELLNFNKSQSSTFDSNTLGYIGTFSRDRNVPTFWLQTGPGASLNPLPARFLISTLSIVTPNPPTSSAVALQQKFGLQWVTPPGRWKYVGSNTNGAAASNIAPLTAGTGNFFQLLSYARSSSTAIPSIAETLSLGAAIIDQYDADVSTTQIEYVDTAGLVAVAYGMESNDPSRPAGGTTPAPTPPTGPPVYKMLPTPTPGNAWDKPIRNVGEFGYAYSPSSPNSSKTLDFFTVNGSIGDARILDLFTHNNAGSPWGGVPTGLYRAGQVNLNTQNDAVLAAILTAAFTGTTTGTGLSASSAASAATAIVNETKNTPALGRQDISRICAAVGVGSALGSSEENKETLARALGEICSTRTWGLFIDVIAQSGHCTPSATTLADFAVEGEKRYWLHVAIDRFSGDTIDQQLEQVLE